MLGYVGYTVYTCIYMYIHGFTAIDWNTKESSICHSHSWGFPWNIFQKSCAESESIWTYARTSPKKTELYTLEMPRTLWQFKIAIMLSKMAHDLRKMVIFRGYIKLPEGSRRYIKTLPIALIILICIWSSVGLLIWLFRRFLLLAMGMTELAECYVGVKHPQWSDQGSPPWWKSSIRLYLTTDNPRIWWVATKSKSMPPVDPVLSKDPC